MEYWMLYQRFAIPEVSDSYWADLISEAGKLTNRYAGTDIEFLSRETVKALIGSLERKARGDRG